MQKMGVFMGVSDHQFFLINKKKIKKNCQILHQVSVGRQQYNRMLNFYEN